MSRHQASAPMLGYLYQVRYALALLLEADNEQVSVCIEKFDDIAFSEDGSNPIDLIQLKHHIKGRGNLSNTSVDLWRTLNVWLDAIQAGSHPDARYLIITTSSAPDGSIASELKSNTSNLENGKRDCNKLYEHLREIAEAAKQESNKKYYENFLNVPAEKVRKLLANIIVLDDSKDIINLVDSIKKTLRYSTRAEYIDMIYERVEGWWFRKSIEALSSAEPVFISQSEAGHIIRDVASQYTPDNLPIDVEYPSENEIYTFPFEERLFSKQLDLIAIGKKRATICLRDFFRAFTQRNRWVQDELLCIDELDRYEEKLIDEWQHHFFRMQDEAKEYDEKEKETAGRALLSKIEDQDIRIRALCSDRFVMRGSYHILANKLTVGWHPEYEWHFHNTSLEKDAL